MRQPIQKSLHFQNCLPADRDTVGIREMGVVTQKQVADAFAAWEQRRGITRPAFRYGRATEEPKRELKPAREPKLARPKLTDAERVAHKRAWYAQNRERVLARNAEYKRKRVLTPEQKQHALEQKRAWNDRNREAVRAAGRAYAARKREEAKH